MAAHKIKYLSIIFENQLKPWQLSEFRTNIIQLVGKENILFHNHVGKGFRYKYPLIQYKIIHRNPALVCINEGTDEIHTFFQEKNRQIYINNLNYELQIKQLQMNIFTMQVWDKTFNYAICQWLPFNEENFETFKKICNENEQNQFLIQILTGNILSFAKGINWNIDKNIIITQLNIHKKAENTIKGIKFLSIDAKFTTNVFLPRYIGLGKAVSKGFGIVNSLENK